MATSRKTASAKSRSLKYVKPENEAPEDRYKSIELEAYLLAEKRGFKDGDPVTDWHMAEANINRENGLSAGKQAG
ncbi:MAG: DUF2934 domain-containing protein [Chloroflexi bacterium]|nr:DUF2934 domain-containing protein [Chloroflexota bacterium]